MGSMPKTYRDDIQGLRAVAVGLVVFFHAFPHLLPGGFVGVDVFFVISGYVITNSIANDISKNGSSLGPLLFRFYQKRIRRILPALSVTLVATLIAGWFLSPPSEYSAISESVVFSAIGAGNLYFYWNTGYFNPAAAEQPLLHMWSLGVEEQFYLVWPLLLSLILWMLRDRTASIFPTMAALVVIGFAYSVHIAAIDPNAAFYLPAPRAWELGAGALLSFAPKISSRTISNVMGIVGVALIGWISFTLNSGDTSTGWPMLPVIVGAALLVWPRQDNWTARLLRKGPFRAVGTVSFSLYLWHWPLLSFSDLLAIDSVWVRTAIIPTSIILATATYLLVERPALSGKRTRIAVPISLSSTAVSAALGIAVISSAGAPFRIPADVEAALSVADYDYSYRTRFPSCWLVDQMTFSDYGQECGIGDVLIWGDSHAAMLYPGATKVFGSVSQFTRSSCWPLLTGGQGECALGNQAIMNKIREAKPHTVILFAAWLNYDLVWDDDWPHEDALRKTVRELLAAGVDNVQVLGPAPYWEPSLPRKVYNFWATKKSLPDRIAPSNRPHRAANDIIKKIVETEGAVFVSVYDALCDSQGCMVHTPASKSELISWDHGHLTWQGAEYLSGLLFDRYP